MNTEWKAGVLLNVEDLCVGLELKTSPHTEAGGERHGCGIPGPGIRK